MFHPETVWEFDAADRIKFGTGAVTELEDELDGWSATRVLVITDEGVLDAGVVDQVIDAIGPEVDHRVFSSVEPDPSIDVFRAAIETAETFDPDVVVGIGGGSSMDVAKTTSVVHEHGGEIMDYVAPPTGEGKSFPGPGLTSVMVPTTAGTGSETSPVSVVSLPDQKLKVGVSSRHQYPNLVVVDPSLTVSLPPGPTASSGMDALSHAIEAYTTRSFDAKPRPESPGERPDYGGRTILTDRFAETAIELIANNLRRAVNNGQDLEARRNMALGSLMAGVAFTNAGLGATHALAYPVAGEHHTPHGLTIAVLLPAVMRFNASSSFDRYGKIAELFGEEVAGTSPDEVAATAATAVEKLATDVGVPDSLAALGVTEDELTRFAEESMKVKRLLDGNPRQIDADDAERIFEDAM